MQLVRTLPTSYAVAAVQQCTFPFASLQQGIDCCCIAIRAYTIDMSAEDACARIGTVRTLKTQGRRRQAVLPLCQPTAHADVLMVALQLRSLPGMRPPILAPVVRDTGHAILRH